MFRYEFLEDSKSSPLIVSYGELGTCQLLAEKQTKTLYALKLASKAQAINDIKCLTRMNHPNIIKVVDHLQHEDNMLLIFQFMPNGDLYTKIRCGELKVGHIPTIFKGICSAVEYIHSKGVIHRNLKSEAILLDANMNPKLVDFGLAARMTTRKTFVGCYYYMAPELLMGKPYDSKVDVWALGIILYEMFYGSLPFEGEQPQELLVSIDQYIESQEQQTKPNSPKHLLAWMLTKDPSKRPTIHQVLQHPFVKTKHLAKKSPLETNHIFQSSKRKTTELPQTTRHCFSRGYSSNQNYRQNKDDKFSERTEYSPFQWAKKFVENKFKGLFDTNDFKNNPRFCFTVSEQQ